MQEKDEYLESLQNKMHLLARSTYTAARMFPKEELFAASSQLRRAVLSVPLNFIEGYARKRPAVKLNFWETSYGSLKEARYLVFFGYEEQWIPQNTYETLLKQYDEIGAMLWRAIASLQKNA